MRFLKLFLVGFVGLFVFTILLSLLFPSNPQVRRSIVISGASQDSIAACLQNLQSWTVWHPLLSSSDHTTDISMSAENIRCKVRGKLLQIKRTSVKERSVAVVINSPGESPIHCLVSCQTLPGLNEVRVEWLAIHHLSWYPWHKFYAIFLDQLAGPGYEAALVGLREYCMQDFRN